MLGKHHGFVYAMDIATVTLRLLVVNIWLGCSIALIPTLACLAEFIDKSEKRVEFRNEQVMPVDSCV